ncbi:ZP domain-containing protein [Caerostris darwini]|uniref:ZP domain-containing protein n=1 Tax=Caerostris darwini TaxID=1538125 RepID=A0AAV4WM13_9ARAC|nr:ZP domain-containing protein [Caerostris darwini]
MISILLLIQIVSFSTLTFGTDIPYDTDTESLQTSSTSTTLSLLDYNETISNVTEKQNDNFTSDSESSEGRFVSLTKDLAVEDTENLKEFVITRKVPDTLTTSDNVTLDLTSQSDVSATEDMPFALSHSMNDSENQTVGNNNNEEIISHVNSTETLNNNLNVTGRMLRDEESIDLSTKSMIKPEALTTLDLLDENETRLYIDLDSTEPLANATTLHYYEKSSKPYFTTQTESDTELNENKTLMTTVEMNAKNDEIRINETDMAVKENNGVQNVSQSYNEMLSVSTVTTDSQLDLKNNNSALSTLREQREGPNQSYTDFKEATSTADHFEYSPDSTIDTTEKDNFEYSDSNEDSSKETKLIVNSTRIPKRIQNKQERYPEGRVRPARPDPGYTNRQEIDLVRPYRPDSPINQYPYYRPTPDSRTPIIRQDNEYTRPVRPDSESQRASFRPNYSYSKTSQEEKPSTRQSTFNSATAKPYRPSFNHPYVPQGSFGRPYRPDYQRPSSKPDGITYKPSTSGTSSHDLELFEHSRADYEYTRQSESVPVYSKNSPSESRRPVKPEESRPYLGNRPVYDIITEDPVESNPLFNDANSKIPKPSIETARPASFYPKPGFGNNYLPSDTSVKPFSVGTVVSTKNLTRVEYIKADCFDNHMKVTMRFNGTFDGLIYSSGYTQDSSCNYVNGSGRNHYEFFIRLNRCGTLGQQEVSEDNLGPITRRRQERAQYLVNTVTVQYNPVIEEDIDEHFRVTCEYGYDFWKTVTFPVINVESSVARSASVKLRTGSPVVFTLPPPQCNMEVRRGFGPSGIRISGPVNVGDPITLVIHMKSESTGFDILVSNCFAHNGAQKRLQLIDSNGCVIQEKLISPFRGVSSPDRSQQVTLYSYLKAFRFTGSPALYLECDVHMCHGSCPPQRCYWRNLYKRSAEELTTEASTESDSVVSESVSLFQALEVRHVEVDSPMALKNSHWKHEDDMVCIRTGGFAAIFACVLLLLLLTTSMAVCMCMRMRRMKNYMETPDIKHFVDFDGHIPLK